MRTKALLLAAAFAAVGAATSMAQVYSVNAVGYVNTTLKAGPGGKSGFNLISNPLTAANNSINGLFQNMAGGVPNGTTVFRFANGNFVTYGYDDLDGFYSPKPDSDVDTVLPGEGVFLKLPPGSTDKVLTFVGEVKQGGSISIPVGFSIRSSIVPQDVIPNQVKNTDGSSAAIPAGNGDTLFTFNTATQNFDTYVWDELNGTNGDFSPPLPVIKVGQAFFYRRFGTAATWSRTFSVNNPT